MKQVTTEKERTGCIAASLSTPSSLAVLAAVLALGCAGSPQPDLSAREETGRESSAYSVPVPGSLGFAMGYSDGVEIAQAPPPGRRLFETPEAAPTPAPRPRRLDYSRPAPINPPPSNVESDEVLPEMFIFGEDLGAMIAPDTALTSDAIASPEPLFDAKERQAKLSYMQAVLLDQTGYPTDSLKYYLEATERDPENLYLKVRAAEASLRQQDLRAANRIAEEVLKKDSNHIDAMLVMGDIATMQEKYTAAEEWYEKVAKLKPRNVAALESLARLAYSRNQFERTMELTSTILEVDRRNLQALLWSAESSAQSGDMERAADHYAQLISNRPTLIGRIAEMSRRLRGMGRDDDAMLLLQRGVQIDPTERTVVTLWEAMLEERGGKEAVHQAYRELVAASPNDLRLQELYASFLSRQGDLEGLIAQRRHMLEVNPDHLESLLALGQVELAQGNTEAATKYFDRAVDTGPEDPDVYRQIARVYLGMKDLERAERLLNKALMLQPDNAETILTMAALAELLNDPVEAERLFKRALDLSPANPALLEALANFYRRDKRMREASGVYEQLLAADADNTQGYIILASLYMELGDSAALDRLQTAASLKAEDKLRFYTQYAALAASYVDWDRVRWALEKSLDLVPNDIQNRHYLAEAYLRLGETDLAIQTLTEIEDKVPEDKESDYNLALASLLQKARRHEAALKPLKWLAEKNADDLEYRQEYIMALHRAGKEQQAREALNEAVRTYGKDKPKEVKLLRAAIYQDQKDYDRALGILRPLADEIEDDAERMDLRFRIAALHGDKGDVANAERLYQDLIRETADQEKFADYQANLHNNLAYVYAVNNVKLDRAEELVRKALELEPRGGHILDTLGWIQFRKGQFEEAEKSLKEAERLSLPDPEISEHLGDLYAATQRTAEARKYYQQALEMEPGRPGLREKLTSLSAKTQ